MADQTRTKNNTPTCQSVEDDVPYSPGSGYPTNESQENTPYSPSGGLTIILGGDDKDSQQGTPSNVTPSGSNQGSKSRDSKEYRGLAQKHKQEADKLVHFSFSRAI